METQRLWIEVASGILAIYAMETDVGIWYIESASECFDRSICLQIPQITIAQKESSRLSALLLSEVSFLVALSSSDSGTSELAAKGLRLISHAERIPGVPVNPFISDEDRSKRNPVYEQLGDITVAGQLNIVCLYQYFILISCRTPQFAEKDPQTHSHAFFFGWYSGHRLARMLYSLESVTRHDL